MYRRRKNKLKSSFQKTTSTKPFFTMPKYFVITPTPQFQQDSDSLQHSILQNKSSTKQNPNNFFLLLLGSAFSKQAKNSVQGFLISVPKARICMGMFMYYNLLIYYLLELACNSDNIVYVSIRLLQLFCFV